MHGDVQSRSADASTGANGLQTIMYAVVPQVIPPFVSFTMYRWDINVRMSTIIGFVGGGGIGFYEPRPGYQTGTPSSDMRTNPDVGFAADPRSGFAVYDTVSVIQIRKPKAAV